MVDPDGRTEDRLGEHRIGDDAAADEAAGGEQEPIGRAAFRLVGAGPGDPELITVRGRNLIARCPVVLYAGSLVPPQLVACAPGGASVIDANGRPLTPTLFGGINGIGDLLFLLMSVSGLVIWWQGRRRWKEGLVIRRGGPRGLNVEGSVATGFESSYKVSLPGEATVEQAAAVNPFDPTTIPVGGSVTLDGGDYTSTSMEASFRHIGIKTNIKDAEGVSYTVERVDENTVRVTTGPTETINAFNGVGLDLGKVSAYAGLAPAPEGDRYHPVHGRVPSGYLGESLFHHPVEAQLGACPPGLGDRWQGMDDVAQ